MEKRRSLGRFSFAILLALIPPLPSKWNGPETASANQKIIRRSPLGDEFRRVPGEAAIGILSAARRYPWKDEDRNNCLFDR